MTGKEYFKKQTLFLLSVACIFIVLIFFFGKKPEVYASGKVQTSITVSFDATGGNADSDAMLTTYGDTYGELPSATRENYIFDGWYTYASGGIKVTEATKIIKPLDHTLYARWLGEEKEITLEPDGGTLNNTTVKVYYGTKFRNQLPIPSKPNNRFLGWYTAASDGDQITVKTIYDDKTPTTLYAHWAESSIKVVFIAFNGEAYEKEVSNGLAYGELPEPEKENYIFGGWYKYKDYTKHNAKAVTADTIVDEVGLIKLFARWYRDAGSQD